MRPKATISKKKEVVRRKNHVHYATHKEQILAKKQIQTFKLEQSQLLIYNENNIEKLNLNHTVDPVSMNETIDDTNTEFFDQHSMNEYVTEVDEDNIHYYDAVDNFRQNEDEEENDEKEEEIEEIEEILTEEQMKFADDFINMETLSIPIREYDELDISVILLMMKKKHKCTNSLINDILKLLIVLKVPRIPSSWYKLKEVIKRVEETSQKEEQMIKLTLYFCPKCQEETTDRNKCTNPNCSFYSNSLIRPHTFMMMDIQQQIEQILKLINHDDLNLSAQTSEEEPTSMTDVFTGCVYKNIVFSLKNERYKLFISLTCNIDGVAVYTSSEQTMWTFTACINELKRSMRFSMEKIIVLAVSVGYKKLSRIIMQKMLVPIVTCLKELQKPTLYQISDCTYQMLRIYLIAISNDKPANSLVQNQPEPNALYGCSKCETAGCTTAAKVYATPTKSIKIKITYIRIFPTPKNEQPELRTNARWYDICHAVRNGVQFYTNDKKLHTFGYIGDCPLCDLAFIDRGTSFTSDTLHSVYHGAFKKLLQLWTESSSKQPWSLTKVLDLIAVDLARIRYPSTTARAPRTIVKCLKLKANECRVVLLIGYPIFKNYLPIVYYEHLQKLAFGISIGESSNISMEKIKEMDLLLTSFVDDFPYNERYIVQTVHCIKHFALTTTDFGPLSNYSTFNYESIIGCLSSSVHGTKEIGTELAINLDLFKKAYYTSMHHCLSSELASFIEYLKTVRTYSSKQRFSNESISEQDLNFLSQLISIERQIKCMKSIVRNGLILSTWTNSKSKTFTDACVVYNHRDIIKYGIIENIFAIEQQAKYVLKVRPLQNTHFDTISFNSKTFVNKHIIYGQLSNAVYDFIYGTDVIEKGCFYESSEMCYFARFPNLYESS